MFRAAALVFAGVGCATIGCHQCSAARIYPDAPTAYPEGGGTPVSTYGHLIVCYLEMQADRQLLGEKRTKAVIQEIPWYTWIWKTVVKDESTIAGVVDANKLEIQ